jgi:hypothetical protein
MTLPELPLSVLVSVALLGLVAAVLVWRCGPRGAAVGLGAGLLALLALFLPRRKPRPDLDRAYEREKQAIDVKRDAESAAIEARHSADVAAADQRLAESRRKPLTQRAADLVKRNRGPLLALALLPALARADDAPATLCVESSDSVTCTPAEFEALVSAGEDAEHARDVARADATAAAAQRVADVAGAARGPPGRSRCAWRRGRVRGRVRARGRGDAVTPAPA